MPYVSSTISTTFPDFYHLRRKRIKNNYFSNNRDCECVSLSFLHVVFQKGGVVNVGNE